MFQLNERRRNYRRFCSAALLLSASLRSHRETKRNAIHLIVTKARVRIPTNLEMFVLSALLPPRFASSSNFAFRLLRLRPRRRFIILLCCVRASAGDEPTSEGEGEKEPKKYYNYAAGSECARRTQIAQHSAL